MGDASVSMPYDVIIIGAGLSGLQAATDLQASGLKIKVLEAKDRVGGKTLSIPTGRGGTVDVGAAWINDTTQRRMWVLAQKFGIDVIKQRSEGRDLQQLDGGSVILLPFGELNVCLTERSWKGQSLTWTSLRQMKR
jgi:monoamine oxidase